MARNHSAKISATEAATIAFLRSGSTGSAHALIADFESLFLRTRPILTSEELERVLSVCVARSSLRMAAH
jgi:hypothetical protein